MTFLREHGSGIIVKGWGRDKNGLGNLVVDPENPQSKRARREGRRDLYSGSPTQLLCDWCFKDGKN